MKQPDPGKKDQAVYSGSVPKLRIICFQNTLFFKGFWKQYRSSYFVTIPSFCSFDPSSGSENKQLRMIISSSFSVFILYGSL